MKLNNTYLILDSGGMAKDSGWARAFGIISNSINAMRWPDRTSVKSFRIPKIVSIPVGGTFTDERGHVKRVTGKKKTLRNGVRPIRDQFRRWMAKNNCKAEEPLSLAPFFQNLRARDSVLFPKYPHTEQRENVVFNESVGDFDFWFETKEGFKLMGRLVDAAVLIVPSRMLYVHLTDRIGNIRELQPYFYFWNQFGTLVQRGLLAVIEVEHDELFKSTDLRDYIGTGSDGNSQRGSSK